MDASAWAAWTGAVIALGAAVWAGVNARSARRDAAEANSALQQLAVNSRRDPWRIDREQGHTNSWHLLINTSGREALNVRVTATGSGNPPQDQQWSNISPGGRQRIQLVRTMGWSDDCVVVEWEGDDGRRQPPWHGSLS